MKEAKSKNGDWEQRVTVPWHDDQMCRVNGYLCCYVGKWGDDAWVCLPGGGKATVSTLRSFPDKYTLEPPTLERTYN